MQHIVKDVKKSGDVTLELTNNFETCKNMRHITEL
jgi:hypothetical protein